MLPDEFELQHKVGDTFRRELAIEVRDTEDDEWVALDLTGYVVEFSLAPQPGRGGVQFLSSDDEPVVTITSAVGGLVLIDVPASVTREWSRFTRYEVTLESPSGVRTSVLDGELVVRLEVVA